jgi:hypothetical protein
MIFKYADRLYDDLNRELTAIKLDEDKKIKILEAASAVCIRYLKRLKDFFLENPPKDREQEIRFFKAVKPKFKSLVIFYLQATNIELRVPVGDKERVATYFASELNILTHFFESQPAFYHYVRIGATYLDEQYFVRGIYNLGLDPDEGVADGDPAFSTSHDNRLAQVLASEMLLAWLEKNILIARNKASTDIKSMMEEELVVWTQTNTALTELIYGWKETKAINNGQLSIERMARYMERVFHAKLDNCYDTWSYICQRTNKTIYLDEMKIALVEKIMLKYK